MHERELGEMKIGFECSSHLLGEDPRYLSPKSKPQYAASRTFLAKHIRLDLKVDVKKKHAQGTCETQFELLEKRDTILLDAMDLHVSNVEVNGSKAKFEYDKKILTITLPQGTKRGKVKVHYSVTDPELGIFFVRPTKDKPHKPFQAWTHSEPEEARYWYPCQDVPESKCPVEMHITVEEPFIVISNGELASRKTAPGKKGWNTFSWSFDTPNASYLNAFMIGDFACVKDKWRNVNIEYYSEKKDAEKLPRTFGKTPQMMEFLSNYLKFPYPFKKYAQVAAADFIFGGMEHTTCTTQTDWALQDEIAHAETPMRPNVLAIHELAHQWFGDIITAKDWPHLWLHEGFATYFEFAWFENQHGKDEYDYLRYLDLQEYLDEDKNHYRRPIVTNIYREPNEIVDNGHAYSKSGLVIALIRDVLGDEGFRESLAHFIQTNAFQNVQTDDLIHSIRATTGRNLTKLFDQWIYDAGYPELKVSVHYDSKKKKAMVRVVQTSRMDDKNLWEFPVTITVTLPNRKEVHHRVNINSREHRFEFPSEGEPLNVVFDSPNIIIKALTTQKSRGMWLHQLRNDSRAIQRIYAAQELAKLPSFDEMLAILERVEKDSYWATRAECTLALKLAGMPEVAEGLIKLYAKEKDHRVQRAMVETLSFYRRDEVFEFLKKVTQRTDSYVVPAEAYRALGRWKDNQDIAFIKKGLDRDSWMDVIPMFATAGLAGIQTEKALKELIALTHPRYSDRIRMTSARAIATVGGKREEAIDALVTLTKDPYVLVQIAAVAALGQAGDERVISALEKLTDGPYDGRVKRAALDSIRMINGGVDVPPYKEEGKEAKKKK